MMLSHRTQDDFKQIQNNEKNKNKVFKITPEISAIKQEYPYHEANFTEDKFIKFVAKKKNRSLVYKQSIYRIVKYNELKRPNGCMVYAVLRDDTCTENNIPEIRILQFTTKDKMPSFESTIKLSYSPIAIKIFANKNQLYFITRAQGYILICREITEQLIPNNIKETHIENIYQWVDQIVGLQKDIIIYGNIWIINLNLHCKKSGKILYAIMDKIDPERNRRFEWSMRNELFTGEQIYELPHISKLPGTEPFLAKMPNLSVSKQILSEQIERICHQKKPWQKVATFTDEKARNMRQTTLTISKKIFLETVIIEFKKGKIEMIYILLFNPLGFSIHPIWKVKIDIGLSVGISFDMHPDPKKRIMMGNGIHVSHELMKVNCQFVNDNETVKRFLSGMISEFNNLYIGDRKTPDNRFKQKSKDCDKYKKECDGYMKECDEHREECKKYKQENEELKAIIERLQSSITCAKNNDNDDVNNSESNITTNKLNPNAMPFIITKKSNVDIMDFIPEDNEIKPLRIV
eukprot:123921_1